MPQIRLKPCHRKESRILLNHFHTYTYNNTYSIHFAFRRGLPGRFDLNPYLGHIRHNPNGGSGFRADLLGNRPRPKPEHGQGEAREEAKAGEDVSTDKVDTVTPIGSDSGQ